MARARRDVSETEPPQQLANRALVISNIPAREDQLPQVNTAPAHHAVALNVGTGFDQRRQRGFLLCAQPPRRPRRLAVDQSLRPRGIEAAHPIAQSLRGHGAQLGRRGPVLAFVSRRNRQQPTRLVGILCFLSRRTHPFGVPIRAQPHRHRHRSPPAQARFLKSQIAARGNPRQSLIPSGGWYKDMLKGPRGEKRPGSRIG